MTHLGAKGEEGTAAGVLSNRSFGRRIDCVYGLCADGQRTIGWVIDDHRCRTVGEDDGRRWSDWDDFAVGRAVGLLWQSDKIEDGLVVNFCIV